MSKIHQKLKAQFKKKWIVIDTPRSLNPALIWCAIYPIFLVMLGQYVTATGIWILLLLIVFARYRNVVSSYSDVVKSARDIIERDELTYQKVREEFNIRYGKP